MAVIRSIPLLALLAACFVLTGCKIGRYIISNPEQNRVIRVDENDRYYFDLDESEAGCRWSAKSDNPDVEVTLDRANATVSVRIRIHRGFNDPAAVTFEKRSTRTKEVLKSFTISCFRTTGHTAFWK